MLISKHIMDPKNPEKLDQIVQDWFSPFLDCDNLRYEKEFSIPVRKMSQEEL